MTTSKVVLGCAIATAMLIASLPANASLVIPASYTFDQPTNSWTGSYLDPSFTKLTDGILGNDGWNANHAVEWVGWYETPVVNIDFTFSSAENISSINFYTAQDNLNDVVFPSLNVYSSNDDVIWTLDGSLTVPPSIANNHSELDTGPATYLTVSGLSIDAKYVRVAALENNGPGTWTFSSEVTFAGSAAPELSTWAMMLLGFAGMGFAGYRRTKKSDATFAAA